MKQRINVCIDQEIYLELYKQQYLKKQILSTTINELLKKYLENENKKIKKIDSLKKQLKEIKEINIIETTTEVKQQIEEKERKEEIEKEKKETLKRKIAIYDGMRLNNPLIDKIK